MRLVVAGFALVVLAACSPQQGTVSDGSGKSGAAPTTAAKTENPTWGKRYTWTDGLAVEVSAPAACKPSEFASPSDVKRAVKVKVLIVNGSPQPFEAAMLTVGGNAQFDGAKAETVFDSSGECGNGGLESGTVLSGKTYTYEVAYSVGAQPGELQLGFEPHLGQDKVNFVGPA